MMTAKENVIRTLRHDNPEWEPTEVMYDIIEAVEPYMPKDKPRYLMGVGTPSNIIEGVARGVDFFDCVMPTRNARHGKLFSWQGSLNIKNAKYKLDDRPIDPACDCPVCRRFSRAYLRHLFTAEEMLGMRLAVMHNQLNLFGKQAQLAAGAEQLEYHSDGKPCRYYSAADMQTIIAAAMHRISFL